MPTPGGKEDVAVPSTVLFVVVVETGCRYWLLLPVFAVVVVDRPGPGYPWSFTPERDPPYELS